VIRVRKELISKDVALDPVVRLQGPPSPPWGRRANVRAFSFSIWTSPFNVNYTTYLCTQYSSLSRACLAIIMGLTSPLLRELATRIPAAVQTTETR
jgi:hypothetical protein